MDFGKGGLGGLAQNLVTEVQKYLKGANYPSNKSNLIQKARDNGAPEPVVKVLEKIQDRVYDKPTDVEREVGKFE